MLRQSPFLIRTAGLLSIVALSASLAFGQPAATSESVLTVGDFLLQYARSVHVALPTNASPEIALAALQAVKALPGETLALNKPLTHGDVVRVGRAAGIKITTKTPDKQFSRPEADMFFETFGGVLATHSGTQQAASGTHGGDVRTAADSSAPDHANTSKGKKKGRPFQSPNEPE